LEEYVIKSICGDFDRFLFFDKTNKLSTTNQLNKASKFKDAGKAWNVLSSQVPKKKRGDYKVVQLIESEEKPKRFHAQNTYAPHHTDFNWNEIQESITSVFANIFKYKTELQAEINRVEAELCDCEHACEFFNYDASKGYKMYKMIHDRRNERRRLKNELWKVEKILTMSHMDVANGKIESQFLEVEQQSYCPRILRELFE
jgi:hypothetical protein